MTARRLALLLPALAALALCALILAGGYVYDDLILLRDNPATHAWNTLWEAFRHPFWEMVPDPRRHASGFYRPLGQVAFVLCWKLGGGAPWAFHALSLALHAACAALVARLALLLGWRPWLAGAAGLYFAVHGAHAEAVAWASSATYLLAGLFVLLSFCARARGRNGAAAVWLIPAVLSQESALGAALLLLALELLRDRRFPRVLLAMLPVYGLRVWAFHSPAAGFDRVLTHFMLPRLEALGVSLAVIGRDLGFLFWPWPHAPFHPLRIDLHLADPARALPALSGAAILLGGGIAWSILLRRRSRLLIPLGLLLACFAPVLKTSSLGQFPFEERFLYLPSIGFVLLAVALLGTRRLGRPLLALAILGNAVTLPLALLPWHDEARLFDWARRASPHAMLSFNEYGRVLLDRAKTAPAHSKERYQLASEAESVFQAGLRISPDRWFISVIDRQNGNVGLASALFVQGDVRTAEAAYRRMLDHWPEIAEAHLGLAACLATEGERLFYQQDRQAAKPKFEEALREYGKALAAVPELLEAKHGKGACLAFLGRIDAALPLLQESFDARPDDFAWATDLASAQMEAGRPVAARLTWETFLRAAPESPHRAEILRTLDALRGNR